MKEGIHPKVYKAKITCACGFEVDALYTNLLQLPPVLHGQAALRGHRRPHRPLPQEVREV